MCFFQPPHFETRLLRELGSNQLEGTIPTEVGMLRSLTVLCVVNTEKKKKDSKMRENWSLLISFSSLNNNQFTGTIPIALTSLNMLHHLCVKIKTQLKHLSLTLAISLLHSNLDNNYLTGPVPRFPAPQLSWYEFSTFEAVLVAFSWLNSKLRQ
jgi:hypothetical protein